MKEVDISIILPGFIKQFPPKTVHIDGTFSCGNLLLDAFKNAEHLLITKGPSETKKTDIQLNDTAVLEEIVFSEKIEEKPYYILSHKSMSGLVSPQYLMEFWKNIKSKHTQTITTSTLQHFYTDHFETNIIDVNWLCIGGLQGLQILKGLGEYIQNIQGLIVRTLVEDYNNKHELGCYQADLNTYLVNKGFIEVANLATLHPAFQLGLYIRDHASELKQKSNNLLKEQESKRQLQTEKTKLEQSYAETQNHLKKLISEKTIWQTDLNDLKRDLEDASRQLKDLPSIKTEIKKISHLSTTLNDLRFNIFLNGHANRDVVKKLWTHLAEKYYKNKAFAKAAEYFQLALDIDPDNAWCIQGIAESMARADTAPTSFWYVPEQKINMDIYGRWDATVRTYRRALAIDPKVTSKFNETFPPEILSNGSETTENPIFIVGCGHSGTSILLRIIGNHKNIWPVRKESALFLRPDTWLKDKMSQWDTQSREEKKIRWVEKTPPNIFQIPRLLASRSKAQIIIIIRDGRDVVTSLKNRKGYEHIQDRIDRWLYDNMAGLPYWNHERVHVLKYEDLIAETGKTLKQLCKFLNEPYDSDMLKFHEKQEEWYTDSLKKPKMIKNNQDHNNLRNWQVNQPIFDGRGHWKKGMAKEELQIFETSCKQMMSELGYS